MRIVDRKTFLALPAGTVFCKFDPQPEDGSYHSICHEPLAIKQDTVGDVDFKEIDLFPWFEKVEGDDADHSDFLISMLNGGSSPPLDYEVTTRDGLFDEDQLFAIWDRDDHLRLIRALQNAFDLAHGVQTSDAVDADLATKSCDTA